MLKNLVVALIVMFLLLFVVMLALGPAGFGPLELVLFLALTIAVVIVVGWRTRRTARV